MNDKQQIKKIAQDIAYNCNDLVETSCDGKPCYVCIAEKLANQNYRKLPEDSVVLTREEWEKELWKMHDKGFELSKLFIEKEKQKARKETAREILDEIDNHGVYSKEWTNWLRK